MSTLRRAPHLLTASCAIVAIVSSAVLFGWKFDNALLKSAVPGLTAMNPATALCFLLCTSSLLSLKIAPLSRRGKCYALGSGAVVAAAGVARLAGYAFDFDPVFDRLLFYEQLQREAIANRMAPNTASAFVIAAIAIIGVSRHNKTAVIVGQLAALTTLLVSTLTLAAYSFNALGVAQVATHIPMALHTGALFGVLAFGILVSEPERGLLPPIANSRMSGTFFRPILASAFVVPFVLGILRLWGQQLGLYNLETGVALNVVATTTLMAAVAWLGAKYLDRAELARIEAEGIAEGLREQLELQNRELERRVIERTSELQRSKSEVIERLARACEYRDDQTGWHVARMSRYCGHIAKGLGFDEPRCQLIASASALHDLGKIGVSDLILHKVGKLNEEEVEAMRLHCRIGAALLADGSTELMHLAEQIALCHHEKWDGTGYPAGIAGDLIPIEARIAAVADVFDALTSERPYKAAWPMHEAVNEICRLSGTHFDPEVVQAFRKMLPAIISTRYQFAEHTPSPRLAA